MTHCLYNFVLFFYSEIEKKDFQKQNLQVNLQNVTCALTKAFAKHTLPGCIVPSKCILGSLEKERRLQFRL